MSLVGIGGAPLVMIGAGGYNGTVTRYNNSSSSSNALNNGRQLIGHIWTEDGAAHTIDTTGLSSIGLYLGSVTLANAGSTLKIGIADVDTANGPPPRAVNASNVISFDVSKTLSGGGGGFTQNAWNEFAPDSGSKTISHGDLVALAFQFTAFGGSDTFGIQCVGFGPNMALPCMTTQGGSYAAAPVIPNAVITFADGVRGYFAGGYVYSNLTSVAFNSGSTPNERGNYIKAPVPTTIYGAALNLNTSQDVDVVLYSDPLGTPVAQRTRSIDGNTISSAQDYIVDALFASPYQAAANQELAIVVKPKTTTNSTIYYRQFANAAHQKSEQLGQNCYAISRSGGTGAFASQNSGMDRNCLGLWVGAFDAGGTSKIARVGLHGIDQGVAA